MSDNISKCNKRIFFEIALILNRDLFNENRISYKVFRHVEDSLLKEISENSIEKY